MPYHILCKKLYTKAEGEIIPTYIDETSSIILAHERHLFLV
jgi:hypothetical protein